MPSERGVVPVLLAVLVAAALAYVPAAGKDFHWDDGLAVLAKPSVIDPGTLGWRDFFPPALGRDRTLTDLTFAANLALAGEVAAPFVASNVAIHLSAALLAWAVARAILRRVGHPGSSWLGALAAALFALHPLQTEAVSYVSQRAESLSSALYLAALLLGLTAEREYPGGRWGRWACGAALVFLAAVSAKAVALTAPVAFLLVVAVSPKGRTRGGGFWMAVAAPIAVSVALGVTTVASLGGAKDAGLSAGDLGPWRYLLTQAFVVLRYVALLFWPPAQSVDHAVRPSPGLADPVTLSSVAAVVALLGAAAWLLHRGRSSRSPAAAAGAVGLLWYFVLLAPTSSLVPLADPMAEHRTYLANLGLFLAGVVGVDALLRSRSTETGRARAGAAVAVAVLASLTIALWSRNRVWGDELLLWTDAAAKAPLHYRPHLHAGNALLDRGRGEEALGHYRKAAERVPWGDERATIVVRALANALSTTGRAHEAIAVLEDAVARAPAHAGLREALAWARYAAGDAEGAMREVLAGRPLAPDSADLAAVAGKVAAERGDLATALRELARAVELAPRSPMRRAELAIVSRMAGWNDRACDEISRFIAIEPDQDARAEGERLRVEWGCAAP